MDNKLRKQVEEAQALAELENMAGWKIIKDWVEASINESKGYVFNTKKVKNWNDFMDIRGGYQYAVKLLFMIEQKKRLGEQAREKLDES